jgi:hypothetical protein
MSLVLQGATRLIEATGIPGVIIVYLVVTFGVNQDSYRDFIRVRPPDDQEATFFRIPADGQILGFDIYRVVFDESGDRIRLTITIYPVDRNRLLINVGAVPPRASDAATSGNESASTAEDGPLPLVTARSPNLRCRRCHPDVPPSCDQQHTEFARWPCVPL